VEHLKARSPLTGAKGGGVAVDVVLRVRVASLVAVVAERL
jgi:hypothetical protein